MLGERADTRRISIHAPPRGATGKRRLACEPPRHFNSRPSARGDSRIASSAFSRKYFNSRPSARGDGNDGDSRRNARKISIHAPPRGATDCQRVQPFLLFISIHAPPRGATARVRALYPRHDFNSRPSARGDHHATCKARKERYFNSRPSARGDRWRGAPGIARENFNSRPSARGDDTPAPRPGSRAISIHAPPRGATPAGK